MQVVLFIVGTPFFWSGGVGWAMPLGDLAQKRYSSFSLSAEFEGVSGSFNFGVDFPFVTSMKERKPCDLPKNYLWIMGMQAFIGAIRYDEGFAMKAKVGFGPYFMYIEKLSGSMGLSSELGFPMEISKKLEVTPLAKYILIFGRIPKQVLSLLLMMRIAL